MGSALSSARTVGVSRSSAPSASLSHLIVMRDVTGQVTNNRQYQSVTAPRLAVDTSFAYFAITPRAYLGAGCFHAARRLAISASGTLSWISSLLASMVMESPSWI